MNVTPFATLACVASLSIAQTSQPPAVNEQPEPEVVSEAPPPPPRPAYRPLRFEEDWSVLRDREHTDFWDPIKHIELDRDRNIYLSLGGQYRLRVERFRNFNFGAPANATDTYVLQRIRLHGDLHFGDNFRVFVEGKSALAWDRELPGGRRPLDADELDLQNAFVDITLPLTSEMKLTFRPGRQELLFGRQRLVSPLDWANSRRTFEGFRAMIDVSDWRINAFWTQLVDVRKFDFNKRDSGQDFFGIYATGPVPGAALNADLYWLALDRDDATFGGVTGDERRHTFGGRLSGPIASTGFDFDLEGAYQDGSHAGRDIRAWMIAAEVGRRFTDVAWTPRLELGFGYATGDRDPDDNRLGTFNQLFPLGHAFLGYADTVGRQNVIDVRAGLSARPTSSIEARVDFHSFWRASRDDALYNAGGGVVRAGNLGDSREIGQEIDVVLRWSLDAHAMIEAGYSRLFAGSFISESGASRDIDFFYIQFQYTF